MGQRSQIYIRYHVTSEYGRVYHGLIARYYNWNYGERMVSRARSIMGLLTDEFLKNKELFGDLWRLKKLERFCDVNFDMKDIVLSTDIIQEVAVDRNDNPEYLFLQPNNDGQLFIDVTNDGIKYCFMDYCDEGEPMDAEQYMKWNCEYEDHPDWHQPYEYMSQETISYTEENIKQITVMATLMTEDDLKDFLEEDYGYVLERAKNNRK